MPCYEILGIKICIPSVEEIVEGIVNAIKAPLQDLYNNIASYITSSLSPLSNLLNSISNNLLSGLTSISNSFSQLGNQLLGLQQEIINNMATVQNAIVENLTSVQNSLLDQFTNLQNLTSQGLAGIANIFAEGFVGIQNLFINMGNQIAGSIDPQKWLDGLKDQLNKIQKGLQDILTPHSPKEPEAAAKEAWNYLVLGNAAFIAIAAAKIAAEALSLGQVDVTLNSIDDMPVLRAYKAAVEKITESALDASLLIPLRYYYLKQHTPMIPSASDLIRFVVRECFPLEKLPEAPEEFVKWMEYQGFRKEWAKAYWEAHWQLPSPEKIYEAFHRGILSEDEVRKYIVWHDYKPTPRPGISKSDVDIMLELTYRLPTRTEARMMYEMGLLGDQEIQEIVKAEGVHPKYQDKFKRFIKEFALRDDLRRIEREARYLFIQDKIDESEYRKYLKEARIPGEFHDLFVMLAKMEKERKKKEAEQEERVVTYSQYAWAFRHGIISRDEFKQKLLDLGYGEDAAELLITIEHARKFDSLIDRYIKRLEDLYEEGWISETELRDNLLALGLSDEEVELRIKIKKLEMVPKRKTLTMSQVMKALKLGIISIDEAVERLRKMGYEDRDIAILLQLYIPELREIPEGAE